MLKLLLVAILAGSVTFSLEIELNDSNPETDNNTDCPEALQRFTDAFLSFSTKLLKSYADYSPSGTGALSPVPFILNTAKFALFAEGVTKNETYSAFNLTTRDEIICVANNLYNEQKNLPDCITYRSFSNLYGNINNYPLTAELIKLVAKNGLGAAENLDFSNSSQADDTINTMVASATDNQIPTIIEKDSLINNCTQLVVVSGSYFEGEWEIGFQISNHLKEFRVSPTKSEPQTFLYQEAEYLYAHSDLLGAEVIQINFCCDSFYLWEVLPDRPFEEDAVIAKMAKNIDWYYEVLEKVKLTRLHLHIPKYRKSTTVDTEVAFQVGNGISSLYDDDTINLKGAIEGDIPAAISIGRHSTSIYTPSKGGPVPDGTQSGPAKIISADYPHVWIAFQNGRVYLIGVDRSPVDKA